jgi:hypothetical protein
MESNTTRTVKQTSYNARNSNPEAQKCHIAHRLFPNVTVPTKCWPQTTRISTVWYMTFNLNQCFSLRQLCSQISFPFRYTDQSLSTVCPCTTTRWSECNCHFPAPCRNCMTQRQALEGFLIRIKYTSIETIKSTYLYCKRSLWQTRGINKGR